MSTVTKTAIFLLVNLFILNSTAISQKDTPPPRVIFTPTQSPPQTPNSKTLIIVYSDGEQIELTNWLWYYTSSVWVTPEEPKKKKRGILSEIFNPPSIEERMRESIPEPIRDRPVQVQQVNRVPSKNLRLSMEGLSKPGVSLDNIELSETQFSSIKFIWNAQELNKVTVSLTNGKTLEFPWLRPVNGQALYLEGDTNVNGFSGKFSKGLSTSLYSEIGVIVEIKIK